MNKFIIASALLLALPLAVFGGVGDRVISVGPRLSCFTPADADSGQWTGGLQGRLHMSPGLALEGSIDFENNTFGNNITSVKAYPVLASLLVYLMPGSNWSPFLLGGAGWYYTQVNGPAGFSDTSYRFGTHAGAGIEVMLNEDISVDGTYRYIWVENVASRDLVAVNKTYQFSGSMVTLAINFLFL